MTTSEPDPGAAARKPPLRRIAVVVACLLCAALAIWSERRTIGTAVIDRTLAKAQVRARYRIADLGLGRQRLVDVVIGDPARPDLTARWIELRTRLGWDGASVTAVRAGGLRVNGAVKDGRLSLGEIDRLLPASAGGGGFRLPAIALDVADARARVTSVLGVVEVALTGSGRLDDGFRGRVTATGGRLGVNGCAAQALTLRGSVASARGAVTLTGPLDARRLGCLGGTAERPNADLRVTLGEGMRDWRGSVAVRVARLAFSSFGTREVEGRLTFSGSVRTTSGMLALTAGRARVERLTSRSLSAAGRFVLGADPGFTGQVGAGGVRAPAGTIGALRRSASAAAGTPLGPVVAAAGGAFARAADDFDVRARLAFEDGALSVSQVEAASRSGARATFVAAAPINTSGGAIAGTARLEGGGLPAATVQLAQSGGGAPVRGVASFAPYVAGGARLALEPLRFASSPAGGEAASVATLSGPLPGGRVDGLRLPLAARWSRAGGMTLNPGCPTASFDALATAALRLRRTDIPVCALGSSLIRLRDGEVTGGARLPALRLTGALGGSPLSLSAADVRIALAARRVEARDIAARLGAGEGGTRLAFADLRGTLTPSGLAGTFAGAEGRIGQVPLLLADGTGKWKVAGSALTVAAAGTLTDAGASARFKPLRAEALDLRLADSAITATARLVVPGNAGRIADVSLAHDLGSGTGSAALAVPALAFTEGFQPDALTPVTFGVIADVRGTVLGDARIAWSRTGVTSTGTFRTDALDFAAAFGPVRGLAGTIRFTDLLALESAPDQVATVASINPGVPVEDGRIVYTLLPDARVHVASGHWPFAGGSLDLRPTTLTFAGSSERRLTFALDRVDAGRFLQQFDFDNLSATGTFDGTLPMVFAANGGRIEGGALRVRRGGGNLAYLGELTQEDLGTWGNLAFQALRSIDYRDLAIAVNGPLAGEMITDVRFAGVSQGKGAKSNFLVRRLQRLPLVFNIRIQAPFRGLIDSAQSFYDPSRLITRNLPALIRQQEGAPPIQPGASEPAP